MLQEATGQAFLKAGFLGFQGSGKTYTAIELAIGFIKHSAFAGPIAMFDTETGSAYVRTRVKNELGKPLLVEKARSLDALMAFTREAEKVGAFVIVDSITHVWREVCDSYLRERQAEQRARGWKRVSTKLEFSDWSTIKSRWQAWPDWYLNSDSHVIVCGRAGYEYDMDKDEDGKKELIKTGIKMKVEGEFGFEPSLLVEMQREFASDKRGVMTDERKTINRAIILKDRFSLIDGMTFEDPKFKDFLPHIAELTPGDHATIDTASRTHFGLGEQGDDWGREKNRREVLSEEIVAALERVWPSQTADDKRSRKDAMARYWETESWKRISDLTPSPRMRAGLDALLREHPEAVRPPPAPIVVPPAAAVAQAEAGAPASHPPAAETPAVHCRFCGVPIADGTACAACEVPDLTTGGTASASA